MSNEFLPFCETDTGTNLLSQAAYDAATDRTEGNQPGIASSQLVNKAIRQSSMVTSQLAQLAANRGGGNILDDGNTTRLLQQLSALITPLKFVRTAYTTGSGTHNLSYVFFIASGSATAGATYTNNAITYTVVETVASGTLLIASGSGAPATSGTLTKATGSGDATLTFYAVRAPLLITVKMAGGGGGGAGSGTASAGLGGAGGNTTFGTSVFTCNGGAAGTVLGNGSAGGTATIAGVGGGFAYSGGAGDALPLDATSPYKAGNGGSTPFAQGGRGTNVGLAGAAGATNSGAGGGGGGPNAGGVFAGGGGGGGGYVEGYIQSPTGSYAYAVGAAGTAGSAGTSGTAGGAGAAGVIYVTESYQ